MLIDNPDAGRCVREQEIKIDHAMERELAMTVQNAHDQHR
jgi:hypothetical protein